MDGRSSWWYDVGALKAVHEVEANGGPAPTQVSKLVYDGPCFAKMISGSDKPMICLASCD